MVSLFYLIIYMEAAKLCKQTAAAAAVCLHNLHNFAEPSVKHININLGRFGRVIDQITSLARATKKVVCFPYKCP